MRTRSPGRRRSSPRHLSEKGVEEEVPPEELFDKLQPFKELVAEDIESDGAEESGGG